MDRQADRYLIEIEHLKQRVAALRAASNSAFPEITFGDMLHHELWEKFHHAVKEQSIAISRNDDRAKFVLDVAFGSEICIPASAAEVFKLIFLAFRHSRGTDGLCGALLNLYTFRDELASGMARGIVWHRHLSDVKTIPATEYVTLRDWLKEQGYDVALLLE